MTFNVVQLLSLRPESSHWSDGRESAVTSGHNLSASTSHLFDRDSHNNKHDVNSGNNRPSRAQKTNNRDREMNDGHSLALNTSKSFLKSFHLNFYHFFIRVIKKLIHFR